MEEAPSTTSRKFTATFGHLALYKDDDEGSGAATLFSAYTTPGPKERASSAHKKARIRNLGPEFGTAVGILFYLANTVAASMYIVGGVEVFLMYLWPDAAIGGSDALHSPDFFGPKYNNFRLYGTFFLIVQVIIVAMGVKFVQLMAPVSLMCVILALLACFAGGIEKGITQTGQILTRAFCDTKEFCSDYTKITMKCNMGFPGFNMDTLKENWGAGYMSEHDVLPGERGKEGVEVIQDETSTFAALLAIYFPAVTGIFTGTNMSGDLKDPQRSIPTGTIAATVTTSIIYFALALLFGASVDRAVLRDKFGRSIDNTMVAAMLAWPTPWIVTVGAVLSTFGAALQCLCSAPRLLQSIAKDDVIPMLAPFARVTKNNEPFLGLMITSVIAECAILMGAVDKIAEVLDFFFLMCYAFVNVICFMHSILKSPNWRPRFRYYHWTLSLLGAFLCFFIMFYSNWKYALLAIGLTAFIYKYVEWKGAKKEWGDGMRGLALTTAQYSLMKVEDKDPHPKNWRPQLLICLKARWSKDLIDKRTMSMLNLAAQLKAGRGLSIACAFVKGSMDSETDRNRAKLIKDQIVRDMQIAKLKGFSKTMFWTNSQATGCISGLYQSIGIGGLKPNTILINWPRLDDADEVHLFCEEVINGAINENCVLVCKGITDFPETADRLTGYIDIWWIIQDGGILMLIAYLLRKNKIWKGCTLRIFAIGESDRGVEMKRDLQKYIYMLRIDAEVFIVDLLDQEISEEVIEKTTQLEQRQKAMRDEFKRTRSGAYFNDGYRDDVDSPAGQIGHRNSSRSLNVQSNDDSTRSSFMVSPPTISVNEDQETSFTTNSFEQFYNNPTLNIELGGDDSTLRINIHKMNTAVHLNKVILENSPDSQLVLLNLPSPPRSRSAFLQSYMIYLDVLSENLKRVLFVGGSGKEVITIES
ncbi:hypothetical protein WR25_25400 [Diploscapter pachys]|uniref:Solute carrier family 12 member 9 n=1 Tax=Diploscapter pachys TaxID=2018661 RepID=A0A2A2JRQ1_9BILA|nr:hypothetical protein WR25_25400 [Diploscapter pachys]